MQNKSIRFFCGVLTATLLLSHPVSAQLFHPETATLKNGLQVIVLPNNRAPVITEMVWVKAGGINDPWGHSGVAHFMEHLMFKGTKNHAEGDYSKIISHLGGQENAFTTLDHTAYYASFAKEHLPQIMALEADRLANWQISEAQLLSERQVILKERQQRTDNEPIAQFWEQVQAALYTNHPYQRPVIGWKTEMETLDLALVTADQKNYYAPGNLVLILSGDITLKDAMPLIEKNFADIPARPVTKDALPDVPPLMGQQQVTMTSPRVQETLWSRHYLVAPARPETIAQSDALMIFSKILGDGRVGRLYRRLVVKEGLATSASISFDPIALGPVRWSIIVVPKPGVALEKIAAAVDDEVAKALQTGFSTQDVKKATQGLQIETTYARDSVMGPAMIMGEAVSSGLDIATVEAWPTRLQAVTPEAVMAAGRAVLSAPPRVTAILQPEKK